MNIVSIFIAGAKNLDKQRLGLKALANDLNTKYGRQKLKISLVAHSYENFGEIQADYNAFIENQADLVVFVLEERIGKKTEEEFLLATNTYKKRKRPKIITFVHSFEKRTPEIDHIEQLINSNTDSYYVEYKNDEDLFALAKDRFNSYVEDRIKKTSFASGSVLDGKHFCISLWVCCWHRYFSLPVFCLVQRTILS